MGRLIVGILIGVLIALAVGYFVTAHYRAADAASQNRIADLEDQLAHLQAQNQTAAAELAKVQHEEERLAAANEQLSLELQKARLTGKVPPAPPGGLPYPPK